ncbi:MAG: hypothetical protein ABSE73_03145 [Planctomycetota bacterium]
MARTFSRLVLLVFLLGCGSPSQPVQAPPPAQPAPQPKQGETSSPSDPVKQLKQVALSFNGKKMPCDDSDHLGRPLYSLPITTSDISYDVEKTNSLVSPYSGTILLKCSLRNAKCYEYTLTYAYQDGVWVWKASKGITYWGGDMAKVLYDNKPVPAPLEFRPGMEK